MAYLYRCDQCGATWHEKENRPQWNVSRREHGDHWKLDVDVDLCSMPCLKTWATQQTEPEA